MTTRASGVQAAEESVWDFSRTPAGRETGKRLRWELPWDGRKAGKEGKEAGGPRRCLIIPGASPAKNPGEQFYRHLMKVPGKWDSDRN